MKFIQNFNSINGRKKFTIISSTCDGECILKRFTPSAMFHFFHSKLNIKEDQVSVTTVKLQYRNVTINHVCKSDTLQHGIKHKNRYSGKNHMSKK